ncbi:MAG: zinc ribbon domain-containing protein [Gemmatimonadetes bacterium]|nr:zinc ribbon domain-containing protein [Gemmatimonadota bacterium]
MTLIKCPQCGHTVLSVASQCPACFTALGITFLGPEHRGELAECRSCGHPVRSNTRVCPHCKARHPARHNRAARRAVGLLSALTVLLVLATGVWKRVWEGLPGMRTHRAASVVETPAAPVVEPPVAAPVSVPVEIRTLEAESLPVAALEVPTSRPDSTMADHGVSTPLQQGSLLVAPPIPAAAPALETRWTLVWTNVRERPSNEAPVLRVFRPGTEVHGTAGRYGWWSIQLGGDSIGYIAGALLRR